MITTVIIAIVCFAVGGGLSYMLFRYGLKSKYDIIIKEAQTEAEVIKKNKLLEVKRKIPEQKADLEKVALRNQKKIQQAENKLKQRELMLNQKTGRGSTQTYRSGSYQRKSRSSNCHHRQEKG